MAPILHLCAAEGEREEGNLGELGELVPIRLSSCDLIAAQREEKERRHSLGVSTAVQDLLPRQTSSVERLKAKVEPLLT